MLLPPAAPYFYAAVGEVLTTFEVNPENASLRRGNSLSLPAGVQYAWRHPTQAVLYVVSSDGGPGRTGRVNHASALRIDGSSGDLSYLGHARELPARPIHCTVDAGGRFLLVAYNNPSLLTVHRFEDDGSVGPSIAQDPNLDFGVFAHQIRMMPSDRCVILPVRGNDETDERPADTGALLTYHLDDSGRLSPVDTISPIDGFGPRHLDIHPNQRWMYVSIERQNLVQLYDIDESGQGLSGPRSSVDSLAGPRKPKVRQIASAIRVHPNGRFVYQANRSDRFYDHDGWRVGYVGEDTIAVYAIDPCTGEPSAIQHAAVRGIHTRTLSIDATGNLLISATIAPVPVNLPDGNLQIAPAAISVFRIGQDGTLDLARHYDVNTADKLMFWTGMVSIE